MRTGLRTEVSEDRQEVTKQDEKHEGTAPVFGPPLPAEGAIINSYGPAPEKKQSWIIALGPGVVRGFASAGVIKSLRSLKWQVNYIIATEMGALVAALYSSSQSINHFEWALMKVNEEMFIEPQGFIGKLTHGSNPRQKLQSFLEKTFQNKTFKDLKIPLKIVAQNPKNHEYFIIDEGRVVDALMAALAIPGYLPPYGGHFGKNHLVLSSARQGSDVILEKAQELPHDYILNVQLSAQINKRGGNLDQGDIFFLRPHLEDIQDSDFTKKNESVFRGKDSMDQQISHIQESILGEKKHE